MRTILILICALFTASALFGQRVSLGTEAGIISSVNTDYNFADLENRRNTYYTGINLTYKFHNRLSFSTGLHYLRQGYKHSTCYIFEEGVKNELVGKIDYLAVPVTANISLLKSRKLIASVGFLVSYNIKAVQDHADPVGGCRIYYIPDISPYVQKYSISGIAGLGYKILDNDKIELVTMVKYYQGLTNTFNNPYPNLQWNIDRKYNSALVTTMLNYKL